MATKQIEQILLTNAKKHKFLALDVQGHSFMLCGGNGTGKSTVFQMIDHMLREQPLPDDPVTTDETEGEAEILLSANGTRYRVHRKFTKTKLQRYTLSREAENGRFDTITPALERFKEIFGNVLDMTPLMDMGGKEQIAFVQQVIDKDAGVAQAIADVETRIKELTEERLLTGRDKRTLESKMTVPDFRALVNYVNEEPKKLDEIREKIVDVTAVNAEYTRAQLVNSHVDSSIETLRSIKVKDTEIMDAIDNLVALLDGKRVDVAELQETLKNAAETNKAIEVELEEARVWNVNVEKATEYVQVKENIEVLGKKYDDYTLQIKQEAAGVGTALAKLGLGEIYSELELRYTLDEEGKVTEQGVYLRGLPFNSRQQSYAEMIHICVALSRAFNPDGLCFVRIGHWNELDEDTQKSVLELADANEIQLGIEKVDSGKKLELQLIQK